MIPTKRSASGAKWSDNELRLIWAGYGSGSSGGSGGGSFASILGSVGSSSSVTRRKALAAQ